MKKIVLGIVGPQDLVTRVQEQAVTAKLDHIEIQTYNTSLFEELKILAKKIAESCDALLFTGPGAHEIYKAEEAKLDLEFPPISVSVRYDGSALYRSLYELSIENKGDPSRFTPFTIDRLPINEMNEVLREVRLQEEKMIVINDITSSSTNDWATLHEQHFLTGKSKYAITCLTSVANELIQRGIPVKRVEPTYSSIHSALQIAYAKIESLLQIQSQIAVVLLKWRFPDRRPKNRFSAYRANLKLQENIIDFCESWEASLTFSVDNQAVIYTTMAVAKSFTDNFKHFPLLHTLDEETGNKIFAGIGIGTDTLKAERNAEEAIKYTDLKSNSCAYIMFADGSLMGPLVQSDRIPLKFSKSADNPVLVKLSEQTHLSVVTLTRLLSLAGQQEQENISVHHIAKAFDISLRSARRLLQQLEACGLAEVVGEEQPPGRGRPRQLFRLLFPEELAKKKNG
ncbi:hypothetical protein ACT8ZR_12535 [Neobacillus sp. M.A.Huq-85]